MSEPIGHHQAMEDLAAYIANAFDRCPNFLTSKITEKPSAIGDAAWVAEQLGCSVRTVIRMARQKKIPCLHRANKGKGCPYRFRKVDVLAWLAS
jgi:excisionase family DNA binding protein